MADCVTFGPLDLELSTSGFSVATSRISAFCVSGGIRFGSVLAGSVIAKNATSASPIQNVAIAKGAENACFNVLFIAKLTSQH